MASSVNEGFEEFLSRLVPTEAQRAASAKHRESVKAALEAKLTVNRFFEWSEPQKTDQSQSQLFSDWR